MKHKEGDKLRAIMKRPDSGWYVTNISNTLANLQRTVDGYIETVTLSSDLVAVINEEGRIKGLPYCCTISGLDLVGTVIILGVDGDEFDDCLISLADWKVLVGESKHESD